MNFYLLTNIYSIHELRGFVQEYRLQRVNEYIPNRIISEKQVINSACFFEMPAKNVLHVDLGSNGYFNTSIWLCRSPSEDEVECIFLLNLGGWLAGSKGRKSRMRDLIEVKGQFQMAVPLILLGYGEYIKSPMRPLLISARENWTNWWAVGPSLWRLHSVSFGKWTLHMYWCPMAAATR